VWVLCLQRSRTSVQRSRRLWVVFIWAP